MVVDASLTPASRRFFEKIASELRPAHEGLPGQPPGELPAHERPRADSSFVESGSNSESGIGQLLKVTAPAKHETIEVPLTFDGEFFDLLRNDVLSLDKLQEQEERNMLGEVEALGKEVALVAKPSRFSKSDIDRWREVFELYLEAQVFFATQEQDHGPRSSDRALKQLQQFQAEVERRKLGSRFKLRDSHVAFARFLNLNLSLLKNLQFQELNSLAVSKILKSEAFRV